MRSHDFATPVPANDAVLSTWAAAAATGGTIVRGGEGPALLPACGITSDSRAVRPGSAFVALRGDTHDGHAYLDAAVRAGARLLVVERGRGAAIAQAISSATASASASAWADVVEVTDTLVAWGDLARAHLRAWRRARPDACVVAITGSAGKTTTKELCAALAQAVGPCRATAGNLNNRIGVPAVAFGVTPEHRFAVFEVGMSLPGEIAALAAVVEADVAVLTNVGVAHAGGVGGTRGDVAREKGELFAALSRRATAIPCFDDAAALGQLARTRAGRAVTFGSGVGADYRLVARDAVGLDGAHVRIRRPDGREARTWLALAGEAAALDLAAALAAIEAVAGPFGDAAIDAALRAHAARTPQLRGRMEVRELADGTTVLDDTYNANPESMRAALRTLAEAAGETPGRRAVVVLGEMRELGASGADEHEALGAAIVGARAAFALSCGGLADVAIARAERGGVPVARAADADEAARAAVTHVRPGDLVLVKASRGVGAERVVDALVRAHGGARASVR